jgi:hypothetical protein
MLWIRTLRSSKGKLLWSWEARIYKLPDSRCRQCYTPISIRNHCYIFQCGIIGMSVCMYCLLLSMCMYYVHYVCIYKFMYVCMYSSIYMHINWCIFMCMHDWKHTWIHRSCMSECLQVYKYIYENVPTYNNSQVRFPMRWFLNLPNLSGRTRPWCLLGL